MPHNTKIATCCYCGTRAALVLRGKDRHELSCVACGAPLHDMKMLRSSATRDHPIDPALAPQPRKRISKATPNPLWEREAPKGRKKKKKRKSLTRKFLSEAFDVIEDIFD